MPDHKTLESFAEEVTAFLDANARRSDGVATADRQWGLGSDDTSIFVEVDEETDRRELLAAKRFRAARFDAGLGWISGPAHYGGRELTRDHELLYSAVAETYDIPPMRFFGIGLGMVAPTIHTHGNDDVRMTYLPALYRGDVVGCQLFSEPGAGSDLASVSTSATRSGDGWVVNGQKVWTTGAQHADIGLLLARTELCADGHDGLTVFLVDMHSVGVAVRPLRQMTGGASFNEVFFDDVPIADSHRLGEVGAGWRVALTTLLNERASIGAGGEVSARLEFASFSRLVAMTQHFNADTDSRVRQDLARIYSAERIADWSATRAMEAVRTSGTPGPELSAAKLVRTNNLRRIADFVVDLLGPRVAADTGEWGTYAWTKFLLGVPGLRIAGGSDEIQRKIIGEQVLRLPREAR